MGTIEPEREMVRRILPYAVPALGAAIALGAALGGRPAGWSAGVGVVVVAVNFVASGLSLAWAARISPTVMVGVVLGGFVVRLAAIAGLIAALDTVSWFAPAAFLISVVPTTLLLLAYEARLLSGRMQADLWAFPSERSEVRR